MPGLNDLIFRPGPAEERLAAELERFSFGAAVSPIAEVTPLEGPDNFVKTVVRLGGISLNHAQHPETRQQNVIVTGEGVPERIANLLFVFDTTAQALLPGYGPPASEEIVTELANTIQTLNDTYEAGDR
jgi:hypothetical protein